MAYTFNSERTCPECQAKFASAENKPEYDPVVVVTCPKCGKLLWRPGSDENAALVRFDPDADKGGI